jgi:hypothetical protein
MITATYKGKRYEVEYSVVNVSELEGALRIDAEYYEREYLALKMHSNPKLYELITDIRYGLYVEPDYKQKGISFVRALNLFDFWIDGEILKIEEANVQDNYKLQAGDCLIVRSGANTGNVSCVFPDFQNSTFGSYIIRIRFDNLKIDPYFAALFLTTKFGSLQTKKLKTGSAQLNLNIPNLKEIVIPILSQSFQKQIQNLVLRSYDEKEKSVSLYKKAEDTLLEELGLKDWKPKTKKIFVGGKEYEEEENISIRNLSEVLKADRIDAEYWEPKYEEIITKLNGKIELKPLKKFILSIQKGVEVGSDNYVEEGKPFIRVSNLSINGFMNNDQKYINDEIYNQLKATYEPEVGDLLLTKDATPGIAYVLKDSIKGIISSGILKLKINENEI